MSPFQNHNTYQVMINKAYLMAKQGMTSEQTILTWEHLGTFQLGNVHMLLSTCEHSHVGNTPLSARYSLAFVWSAKKA